MSKIGCQSGNCRWPLSSSSGFCIISNNQWFIESIFDQRIHALCKDSVLSIFAVVCAKLTFWCVLVRIPRVTTICQNRFVFLFKKIHNKKYIHRNLKDYNHNVPSRNLCLNVQRFTDKLEPWKSNNFIWVSDMCIHPNKMILSIFIIYIIKLLLWILC